MRPFIITVVFFCMCSAVVKAQVADTLNLLEDTEEPIQLLPESMMLTPKALYGEKGFLRITGIAPLTSEGRAKELEVRRTMLVAHQLVGYGTLATTIATGVTGQMLYSGENIRDTHRMLAGITNLGYSITAILSVTTPPPLISKRGEKWDTIDWHKTLSLVHFAGMITTNVLSRKAREGGVWKQAHRISGVVTGVAFTAGVVVIMF